MEDKLLEVEQRVKRYWFSDGIGELAMGAMFILLGGYFGIPQYLGDNNRLSVILQSSLILVMIAGIFIVRWLVTVLKTRLTYPRTGYVEYRVDKKDAMRRRYLVMAFAMVVAYLMVLISRSIRLVNSTVLVTGIVIGIVFVLLRGKSFGVQRFYFLGVISLILGVTLSFSKLPNAYSLAAYYGLMGFVVMISGGIVLRRYLSENPMPADAERDNE